MKDKPRDYQAVVLGASVGGLAAMSRLLSALRSDFGLPMLLAQHVSPASDSAFVEQMAKRTRMRVKEAEDKEPVAPGVLYAAPPDYHLQVEPDRTLSLSAEERVCFSRPSIDVLFESAAWVYGSGLAGVVLTGGNDDGGRGLAAIRSRGGLAVVQDPEEAECPIMPGAALEYAGADYVLDLKGVAELLNILQEGGPVRRK